jgi:dTDP-4-dehydrorhamnose reductase
MAGHENAKKPLVLVTGTNGQLGKELQQLAKSFTQFEFLFLSREDLPIHHFELVRNFFKATHPSYLINAAAYTAVDKAEQEKDLAFQVNAEAVGVLAAICREQHCRFLHVSTDYVFDGTAHHPYLETDATNPQGVYGASKLEGEKQAIQYNPASIIIRTSWVYSSFGKNFVKTILRLLQEKPLINVVDDQIGSPTFAADLAAVILQIISASNWNPGIYNYSNSGEISWYTFAKAIAELTNSTTPVHPITTEAFPTPAKRPAWSVLDCAKIAAVYGVSIKPWKNSLAQCLKQIN